MDSLMERTKRLEYESEQQARLAAATERSRIAREMHDVITHSVSIMVTLADGAVATVDAHPVRAKEAMADVSATGRLALTDMRHLLGVFRSEDLAADREPQPQLSGIPRLLQGVRATGLDVRFVKVGAPFEVPPGVELTVFRIVQESLTNVLKHAEEPSTAHVTLTYDRRSSTFASRTTARRVGRESRRARVGGHARTGVTQRRTPRPRARSGWWLGGDGSGESRPVTIRVLLVDDQALLRKGFRMILEEEPGIEVVGEAARRRRGGCPD